MQNKTPSYLSISSNITVDISINLEAIMPDKVAVLVDENTLEHCLPSLNIPYNLLIQIKSGESQKNLHTCEYIWSELTKAGFTRKSLLVNLGGGVITDMGGFAAATYKRGISFIHVPTTLLSQVDASLGGKLGVDFNRLKNHIGIFQVPDKVIIDVNFLKSLPERELRSGFAEIIKHSLIRSKEQWDWLQTQTFDSINWVELIPQSIAIKNEIVTLDPKENGLRKILNYGHTIGHALETCFLKTSHPLLHGEAIALGMILENKISRKMEMISEKEDRRIEKYIRTIFDLPNLLPNYSDLKKYLNQDKKNDSRGIRFSLLEKEGLGTYDVLIEEKILKEVLK